MRSGCEYYVCECANREKQRRYRGSYEGSYASFAVTYGVLCIFQCIHRSKLVLTRY